MTVFRDWANLVFHGDESLHILSLKMLQRGEQDGHRTLTKSGEESVSHKAYFSKSNSSGWEGTYEKRMFPGPAQVN